MRPSDFDGWLLKLVKGQRHPQDSTFCSVAETHPVGPVGLAPSEERSAVRSVVETAVGRSAERPFRPIFPRVFAGLVFPGRSADDTSFRAGLSFAPVSLCVAAAAAALSPVDADLSEDAVGGGFPLVADLSLDEDLSDFAPLSEDDAVGGFSLVADLSRDEDLSDLTALSEVAAFSLEVVDLSREEAGLSSGSGTLVMADLSPMVSLSSETDLPAPPGAGGFLSVFTDLSPPPDDVLSTVTATLSPAVTVLSLGTAPSPEPDLSLSLSLSSPLSGGVAGLSPPMVVIDAGLSSAGLSVLVFLPRSLFSLILR